MEFNKTINESDINRRFINSLRNTPVKWTSLENINNYTYIFKFMNTHMYNGDEDNLIEEFNYINELKNYKINRQHLFCSKSKFKIMQENNDNYIFIAIVSILAIWAFCNCKAF